MYFSPTRREYITDFFHTNPFHNLTVSIKAGIDRQYMVYLAKEHRKSFHSTFQFLKYDMKGRGQFENVDPLFDYKIP